LDLEILHLLTPWGAPQEVIFWSHFEVKKNRRRGCDRSFRAEFFSKCLENHLGRSREGFHWFEDEYTPKCNILGMPWIMTPLWTMSNFAEI